MIEFGKRWGWLQVIYEIAITLHQKIDYVEQMNVVEAMNFYSYITDKNKLSEDVQE